jgi:thiamine-phosphate pyrophosphorylase
LRFGKSLTLSKQFSPYKGSYQVNPQTMSLQQTRPIVYLITSGATTSKTTPKDKEFSNILSLVEAAVADGVSLVQLREKSLSARVLFELVSGAAAITRGSSTRLLVNDRFDIALGAGGDGVQLTSQSMPAHVVRVQCGEEFLIGVSTHSLDEACAARDSGANFVLFGPVFETESKLNYGSPQGVDKLREIVSELEGFPVVAIGGVRAENICECFKAGAAGVAAISLFGDGSKLKTTIDLIRQASTNC